MVRTVAGSLFGLLVAYILMPAFAALNAGPQYGFRAHAAFVLVVLVGGILGLMTRSLRRAIGNALLLTGLPALAMPLTVLLRSGGVAQATVRTPSGADAAIQPDVVALVATDVLPVVILLLGVILLFVGAMLAFGNRLPAIGRWREVRPE